MSMKTTEAGHSRAKMFLRSMAASMPDADPVVAKRNIEATARRIADYFAAKIAEGDVDSVLEVLDDALSHEKDVPVRHGAAGTGEFHRSILDDHAESREAKSVEEVDPYYWG